MLIHRLDPVSVAVMTTPGPTQPLFRNFKLFRQTKHQSPARSGSRGCVRDLAFNAR